MKKIIIGLLVLIFSISIHAQEKPGIRTYSVRINVTDLLKAKKFYNETLGFTIQQEFKETGSILLEPGSGNERILLQKVPYLLPVPENEARASLTLQVNELDSAIGSLKQRGLDFGKYQKRKEGVGYAIHFDDPFGTRLSMMHQTVVATPHFAEPAIYNYGFTIPDMEVAKSFYTSQLGFLIRSEKYLPLDLPLGNPDKSFAFMLHTRNNVEAIRYNAADNQHIVIQFQTRDLETVIKAFQASRVQLVSNRIMKNSLGRSISFYDPFGYISEVIEVKD